MAQSLALTGASARIIAFPNSAPQPVQQTRRAGRLPAGVFPAYKFAIKREERRKADIAIQIRWLIEHGCIQAPDTQMDNAVQTQKRTLAAREQTNQITQGASHV